MTSEGSITRWLHLAQAGDRTAALPLWERFFQCLVAHALNKLRTAPRRAADEEDVALSAFASFYRLAEQGRFPDLKNRKDLWHELLKFTNNKASNLCRDERRLKRGGGRVSAEVDLRPVGQQEGETPLSLIPDQEPTPELGAVMAEEFRRLLNLLEAPVLRSIAVWQMEGYTVQEIADKLGVSASTVARKLKIIRHRWSNEGLPS